MKRGARRIDMQVTYAGSPSERLEVLVRLLDAISQEVMSTAGEISELGKISTDDAVRGDRYARSQKRESFEVLTEKCAANAHLIEVAAHVIESPDHNPALAFAAAIDAIPFRYLRERLDTVLADSPMGRAAIELRELRQIGPPGNGAPENAV